MVSKRIKAVRERVESAKESSRKRKERRQERVREITEPVTTRVESAREEVRETKREAGLLADELGVGGISMPEIDFGGEGQGGGGDGTSFFGDPSSPNESMGMEMPPMNDGLTADDTLGMGSDTLGSGPSLKEDKT